MVLTENITYCCRFNPVYAFKSRGVGKYFKGYMGNENPLTKTKDGIGEICVKGPMVMQGILQYCPEENRKRSLQKDRLV